MKKAFDQNVSRARPRLRLGSMTEALPVEGAEGSDGMAPEENLAAEPVEALAATEAPEALHTTLEAVQEVAAPVEAPAPTVAPPVAHDVLASQVKARIERSREPKVTAVEAVQRALEPAKPVARIESPPELVEVQTPPPPMPPREMP